MCSLIGLWNLSGASVDQDSLDRGTDALTHRGLDGRGIHVDVAANWGWAIAAWPLWS